VFTDILVGDVPKAKENITTLAPNDYRRILVKRLETARDLAKNNVELQQVRSNRISDRQVVEFAVGDKVYVYVPQVKKSNTKKLTLRWHGPYKIIRKIGPVTYHVSPVGTRKAISKAVHVSRMKPYLDPAERESYFDNEDLQWDDAMEPISEFISEAISSDVPNTSISSSSNVQSSAEFTSKVYDPYVDVEQLIDKRTTRNRSRKSITEYLVKYKDGVKKWVPRTHVLRKQITDFNNSRTS
jgi:hypothetical protein